MPLHTPAEREKNKKKNKPKQDAFSGLRESVRELAARAFGGGAIENVVTPLLGVARKKAEQNTKRR